MITTQMIEATALGRTDTVPANDKLYDSQWAVVRLNRLNAITFEYFASRADAVRAAAENEYWFKAIEIVPAVRRLRNDAEIAALTRDAERGDYEAAVFIALWPSILRTARKSAGQETPLGGSQ